MTDWMRLCAGICYGDPVAVHEEMSALEQEALDRIIRKEKGLPDDAPNQTIR